MTVYLCCYHYYLFRLADYRSFLTSETFAIIELTHVKRPINISQYTFLTYLL